MTKQPNFFYFPSGMDLAARFLEIHGNDWQAARRSALTMIDKHRGLYIIRRRYCAAYIWLLLNEPAPRLIGPAPAVISLHFLTFKN